MSKQIIHTDAAPAAVGPYCGRRQRRQDVYLSGQIGLEPGTGDLVSENFDAQVRQAFANMQEVIKAAGGTLDNVVKLTLFLTDLGKFAAANAIMAEIIPQPFPARSTIGVASLPGRAVRGRGHPGPVSTTGAFHYRGAFLHAGRRSTKRASAAKGGAGKPLTDTERKLRNLSGVARRLRAAFAAAL